MSKKVAYIIIALLVITNVVAIYLYYYSISREEAIQYQEKIDSLYYSNDSLEIINQLLINKIDSLSREIGTVDSVIVEIDHWYEKNLDSISSLPDDGQLQFFTDYLSKNSSRFSSSHNNDSIKTN